MNKPLKIHILCNDGSPLHVTLDDLHGKTDRIGVGGAEYALLTLAEAWHNAGHDVTLYNNPLSRGGSPFKQYPIDTFLPLENRDILIIFRSPNKRIKNAVGKKIWFSCDQYTIGDFAKFSTQVDEIVTISPHHAKYFKEVYGIEHTTTIDLPVRTWEYEEKIEKVKNRLIFCSVPDRGLALLARAYPEIKSQIPDLSLTITSDYRLWGTGFAGNESFIRQFMGQEGVRFLGAIPRCELVREQKLAQIQAYPCIYEELFCYSVAECQVAGALPIVSDVGALETTNMGIHITGDPRSDIWRKVFVESIVQTLQDKDLSDRQREVQEKAISRFSLTKILGEWDKIFYNGK